MTATHDTHGPAPAPSPSGPGPLTRYTALVGYVFRACMPTKRLAALSLPVGAILLSGVLTNVAGQAGDNRDFSLIVATIVFGLALPLGSLIIGDSVLGAEVRSGTLAFTWLTPTRFAEIATARWLGGWLVCLVTLVPASALAAIIGGVSDEAGHLALAAAAGTSAHVALFIAIGALTRRAAVWSLGVVFIIERLLGAALSGVAQLSPTWEGQAVYVGLGNVDSVLHRSGISEGKAAVIRLALLTVAFLALATWGLRKMKLAGSRD